MTRSILLSFDVEEFDMPLEYGISFDESSQLLFGKVGLDVITSILQTKNITATLFTTAHFANQFPDVIRSLADKHEIASHTYFHSRFAITDLLASRTRLEEITGKKIIGLRMPRMKATVTAPVLEAGYGYDASIHPTWLPGRYNNLGLPRKPYIDQGLKRIPASVTPILRLPLFWIAFKTYPYDMFKSLAIRTLRHDGHLSLYFHPWEFADLTDIKLPYITRRISGQALTDRLYRLIKDLKREGDFITMQDFAEHISA